MARTIDQIEENERDVKVQLLKIRTKMVKLGNREDWLRGILGDLKKEKEKFK